MATATIKSVPEDFRVFEQLDLEFSGVGEHAYFLVEKTGWNTRDVARAIAEAYAVREMDVGYAGMKDKQAVTQQWFSVVTPADRWLPDLPGIRCLEHARHTRKLRRGQHQGNRFELVLRNVCGADAAAFRALADGFPNAFGSQRLSTDNEAQARAWIQQRPHRKNKRQRRSQREGWHLSVLRSVLFNKVLAARCEHAAAHGQAGPGWLIEGDVAVDGQPTGPLWGRGRSATQAAALTVEQAALAEEAGLCEALEHSGLDQARRKLYEIPGALEVTSPARDQLLLCFTLPPGAYATTMLAALVHLEEQ
ncbi:MAG: tRNA pseudouridine(13) synthase TruD [Pseudomonadota bacterium]